MALNQYLVKCVREKFGRNVVIVLGGPCIDSDKKEQHRFLTNVFPEADAVVLNEGEISFNSIIREIIKEAVRSFPRGNEKVRRWIAARLANPLVC